MSQSIKVFRFLQFILKSTLSPFKECGFTYITKEHQQTFLSSD